MVYRLEFDGIIWHSQGGSRAVFESRWKRASNQPRLHTVSLNFYAS